MKKPMILTLLLAVSVVASAQTLRLQSMGGMTLGIRDTQLSINLYDFGRNPAWLLRDEIQSWLEITPRLDDSWGSYRKKFDPQTFENYRLGFEGVQALGEKGTFRGYASYVYERRRDVYRALKRVPYGGDAFFLTDTTTGNIRYNGPLVQFMYAYDLFDDLLIGVSGTYQILDGLKDRYSRIKTICRNLEGTVGLAYQVTPALSVGATFTPASGQEGIEAKSDEVYSVEVFNFRGETYAFRQMGSSVDHKIKVNGESTSLQAVWQADSSLVIGMRGEYGVDRTHVLVTRSASMEREEGTASLEHYAVDLQVQYVPDNDFSLGVLAQYSKNREWSKYTTLDLLLWDWKTREFALGIGASYSLVPSRWLLGAEYQYSGGKVDSSKYIDNKFRSETFAVHTFRSGVEYQLFENAAARVGYAGRISSFDVVSGGKDVVFHGITGGGTVWINKDIQLDLLIEHGKASPRNSGVSRTVLNAGAALRLWSR
ncbi:MAG: hypothetical protein HY961_20690 [Ignavibacteriae bacterium]|nr:hypothetical protein [Ignavibacteriota bacterium]